MTDNEVNSQKRKPLTNKQQFFLTLAGGVFLLLALGAFRAEANGLQLSYAIKKYGLVGLVGMGLSPTQEIQDMAKEQQQTLAKTRVPTSEDTKAHQAAVSDLPACDSQQAKDDIKNTEENSAYSNLIKVKLLDLDNLAETSFDEGEGVRRCIGDITLNTGKETIFYIFSRKKSDPSEILVQIEELDDHRASILRLEVEQNAERKANIAEADKEKEALPQVQEGLFALPLQKKVALCLSVSDQNKMQEQKVKIVEACQEAARAGSDRAQNALGFYYYNVEKNSDDALKWYTEAAKQGLVTAMYNIGDMYAGAYRWKDAYFWIYLAALKGDSDAKAHIQDVASQYVLGNGSMTEASDRKLLSEVERQARIWLKDNGIAEDNTADK